jgi:hypothetical protein
MWRRYLIDTYGDSEASKIYLLPTHCAIDTRNNYATVTEQVNERNSTTATFQTDPVHPALSGAQQLGDCMYAFLMGLES